MLARKGVDEPEAGIVARQQMFGPWVTQPDNDP
jgi:hypothetical protein